VFVKHSYQTRKSKNVTKYHQKMTTSLASECYKNSVKQQHDTEKCRFPFGETQQQKA